MREACCLSHCLVFYLLEFYSGIMADENADLLEHILGEIRMEEVSNCILKYFTKRCYFFRGFRLGETLHRKSLEKEIVSKTEVL